MIGIMTTTDDGKQTIGKLGLYDSLLKFECMTLEPPWKDNKPFESCIPAGEYIVKPRYTASRGHHLIVTAVPNRTYILFHAFNFVTQSNGCIAPGEYFAKINEDNLRDVANSQDTLEELLKYVPEDGFWLKIDRI